MSTNKEQIVESKQTLMARLDEADRQLRLIKTFVGKWRQGDNPNPEKLLQAQGLRLRKIQKKLIVAKGQERLTHE